MIYLAGGIWGLDRSQITSWREEVKDLLDPLECTDPVDFEFDGRSTPPEDIVRYDTIAIRHCKVVLVNVARPSWGTGMEILLAYQMRVPIIAFGAAPEEVSPWVRHHVTTIANNLDHAVDLVRLELEKDHGTRH